MSTRAILGSAGALALAAILLALPLRGAGSEEPDEHAGSEHGDDHHDHGDEPDRRAFTVADFAKYGVRLATAGPGEVDVGVELPGEVRPNADRIAHIAPRFPGIVREVRAHVGDAVRAGDVLAVVESEHLARFELSAAFDGTVVDKHITPGEAVDRDEPAFIVADLSTVWVVINVYQRALADVRVGQPVVVEASPGRLVATGRVAYITPIVDQATRTASARVVLPNPDGSWRPGLFVSATVFDPIAVGVAVPRRAIQTVQGRPALFVADGERFEVREVRLGREGRTKVEVVSGLAAGERFADERTFLVKAELGKGTAAHAH
jgi:cobalt-zinc-cadmium efflux system membrane fusion protein